MTKKGKIEEFAKDFFVLGDSFNFFNLERNNPCF